MAKENTKVVEMPKVTPQTEKNQPSYNEVMQLAQQLAQQNKILQEKNLILERELTKFTNNYQRTVFLQETLRIDSSYKFLNRGLFGKSTVISASPFDEDLITDYAKELVGLLEESKNFKKEAEKTLKKEVKNEQSTTNTENA